MGGGMRFSVLAGAALAVALLAARPGAAFTSTVSNTTGLAAGDDSDFMAVPAGFGLLIFATYYNATTGLPAPNAACSLSENATGFSGPLAFNNATNRYERNASYPGPGSFGFTVSCSAPGFAPLSLSEPFIVSPHVCAVDIFGMHVAGSLIKGTVNNSGTVPASVSVAVLVNSTQLLNQSVFLNASQSVPISVPHTFAVGDNVVFTRAAAACGSLDNETFVHTVLDPFVCSNPPGQHGQNLCIAAKQQYLVCSGGSWSVISTNGNDYCVNCQTTCGDGACNCGESVATCFQDCTCQQKVLDDFQCAGSTLQVKVQYQNCSTAFVDFVKCPFGCGSGACAPPPVIPPNKTGPGPEPGCGIAITGFQFQKTFPVSQQQVTVGVKNTGTAAHTATAKLALDGAAVNANAASLLPGEEKPILLLYSPAAGTHTLLLNATASCGLSAIAGAVVTAAPPAAPVIGTISPYLFPEPPVPVLETAVTFFPASLDIAILESSVLSIDIQSREPQEFEIQAAGVPGSWLEYPKAVFVPRRETVYVYVLPSETGNRSLSLLVRAGKEGLTFPKTVPLFASPAPGKRPAGLFELAARAASGAVAFVQENPALLALTVVVLLLLALVFGGVKLRGEDLFSPE